MILSPQLHYSSYHTQSLWNNLPYGQFLCIKRNSSKISDYVKNVDKLSQAELQRGYPEEVIGQTRRCADVRHRCELLQDQVNTKDTRLTFAIQFTPLANGIKRSVQKYWHLVGKSTGGRPRIGFRKTASIRNKLMRADSTGREQMVINLKEHHKCRRCSVSDAFIIEGDQLVIPGSSQTIFINPYTNSFSKEVKYYVSCECKKL